VAQDARPTGNTATPATGTRGGLDPAPWTRPRVARLKGRPLCVRTRHSGQGTVLVQQLPETSRLNSLTLGISCRVS
jgi:hypothetical protein